MQSAPASTSQVTANRIAVTLRDTPWRHDDVIAGDVQADDLQACQVEENCEICEEQRTEINRSAQKVEEGHIFTSTLEHLISGASTNFPGVTLKRPNDVRLAALVFHKTFSLCYST